MDATIVKDGMQDDEKQSDEECCVLCGKITPYRRSTPVDYRQHYIEGSGQLCTGCYEKIYGSLEG